MTNRTNNTLLQIKIHETQPAPALSTEQKIDLLLNLIESFFEIAKKMRWSQEFVSSELFNAVTNRNDSSNVKQKQHVIRDIVSIGLNTEKPVANTKSFATQLALQASETANKHQTIGKCYRAVKEALRPFGIHLTGGSAYQAADQLGANKRFKEVTIKPSELHHLPEGSIIVWGYSPQKVHGHISISLGNGIEASDHIQNQITNGARYGGYRVFIPLADEMNQFIRKTARL